MKRLPETHSAAALAAAFAKQPPPPSARSRYGICGRILFGASFALITSTVALAQSDFFTTVDSFPEGEVVDIASDRNGVIYAVGAQGPFGATTGVVRVSSDGGQTWPAEAFSQTDVTGFGAVATGARKVGETAEGSLYENTVVVAGSDSTGQWRVFRSVDGGDWNLVDSLNDSDKPVIQAAAIDADGTIYISATCTIPVTVIERRKVTTQLKTGWLVRRIPRVGVANTYRLTETAGRQNTNPAAIACYERTIYVAGTAADRWQVRRSDDNGVTWALVDDFRQNALYRADAKAITISGGQVYVAGSAYEKSGPGKWDPAQNYWFVRKGTGSAGSFDSMTGFFQWDLHGDPAGIAVDSSGGVHVTGYIFKNDGSGTGLWVIRSFNPASQTWENTDVIGGQGRAITADLFGNVYSAGFVDYWSAWVIRAH
jgi:hypothetical protein